jgi:branched-subunit amino acid aminotransferase/4-amino-4-deoxychorismate lyase
MTQLWCNGQWLDFLDFPSSPMDRGSLHGLGLFETLLALDGAPVFANRHLARLQQACTRLGWSISLPDFHITAAELLARNDLTTGRAKIRLAVTGGSGLIHDLTPGSDRLVWMSALPVGDSSGSLTACLSPWPRNERSPLAGLKCASYAENLIALDHARRQGFDEVIFPNTTGHLCEAATANLFLVSQSTLLTPPLASGCLPGITREVVIGLANGLGIPCEERDLLPGELQRAEEVFLTSSICGVVRLSRFEDHVYSEGRTTQVLRQALQGAISSAVLSQKSK